MAAINIPCTHTGSLPRTDQLIQLMFAAADGIPVDPNAMDSAIHDAITSVVQRQVDAGVSIINDGEMSKPSYATYVQDRLAGFNGEAVQNYFFEDLQDFPRSAEAVAGNPGRRKRKAPSCTGEITVVNGQAAIDDMVALRKAASDCGHDEIFTSAASPGVISLFFFNEYYDSHEAYVFAIAEAMRHEYEAIANAGATVQLDCPDLAMGRHSAYAEMDLDTFRKTIAINIEALNHAVRNIPEDQLRMHLCWGNYPGPHNHDVPISDIIDLVWTAKPQTVLIEGANSRHAHEWAVLEELGVPSNKKLCPGVIEPQSNYIEHPELIAQRLERWARVVDPDRLMAGVDCGFSVHVGSHSIDPDVAFAKLASLAEGCELVSKRL
ncbi:methionine synthase, vitamin-B12 independent [Luminiphilus syltensis NOR5-1B]|uniref:Methionine synthase, vitamin-B12 independent n=1 Tax=Luminiphilus syltensis NOR5-1B TaxID=565045 RepID=B8KSF7_9GAMM|nr:cobalamin-independent methionine synthase II family protein [Luminiphilus syltensis]EED35584.1 methionine synthase, vitamin-B12 independent [Luminiphilus syltensis NOR5-1B]